MPLRDHFRPPLSNRRHWHAFHNAWATYLAADLNARLPEGYFAEPNVQFGIEIDVATFEEPAPTGEYSTGGAENWKPTQPTQVVEFDTPPDRVEIEVFGNQGGPVLAAAIELVSPANKDRDSHRAALTDKCRAYLQAGVGLIIVDVVTTRRASIHYELLSSVGASADESPIYASSYRPVIHGNNAKRQHLEVWWKKLALGQPLPEMPLWMSGHWCLSLNLETSYMRTCQEQRLPDTG